ncbi:SMP-30/gluconolactonase/LRE family protein [Caldivirga sp. UBA161]|uniref:SMP-30/gluconolactonase/LRE family protein n=1 Tax=Caldivirga sp. UBA161 TaxID=1915569 RepID=UPI0025C0C941|nr:SMP-30/gluconolactonase/LRE family protein [Caldivirga sp. UBA161]
MASGLSKPMVLSNVPRSILGEGPIWLPEPGVLYWVDIFGNRVHSYRLSDGSVNSINVGPYPSCVMPNDDGNLIVTIKDKVILVNPSDGSVVRTLATINEGPGNRFNDCKCDPMGRLVAGTMDMSERNPTGSLYILDSRGLRRILASVTISNGIAWSSDGSVMYYIDSPTRRVTVFKYDKSEGALEGTIGYINLSSLPGVPDGMTIDSEDYPWVALYGGGRVIRINPNTRSVVEQVELPAQYTTSCTFGGSDLRTLFITTATDRSRQTSGPDGYVFSLNLNVKGTVVNKCRL